MRGRKFTTADTETRLDAMSRQAASPCPRWLILSAGHTSDSPAALPRRAARDDVLLVAFVAVEDVLDVVDRLKPAAEAELDDLVARVLLRRLLQEPVRDVAPRERVAAVLLREPLRVLDVAGARVVRGEDELEPLALVLDALVPEFVQPLDVADGPGDVLLGVEGVAHADLPRRPRHQLQQALRPGPRLRVGLEARLLIHLRGEEAPVPTDQGRVAPEQVVVGAELARRGGQKVARRALDVAAHVNEVLLIHAREEPRVLLVLDPA